MKKGLAESLLEQGFKAVGRGAGAVISEEHGREVLARAVGLAQRGLRLFESVQEHALHAAGLAARPDYVELRKQVARLKRKARDLAERLEQAPPGGGAEGGSGAGQGKDGSR